VLLNFNERADLLLHSLFTATTMSSVKKQLIVFDFDWYVFPSRFYEISS
jgi:hypothetical protein